MPFAKTSTTNYVICETPQGSFGKDLIMIFNEQTQARIEYGERQPLSQLKKSASDCVKCGYPVLPAGRSQPGAVTLVVLDQLKEKGVGMKCTSCGALCCPFCVDTGAMETCPSCGSKMTLYQE